MESVTAENTACSQAGLGLSSHPRESRPFQIFFAVKDGSGSSKLACLAELHYLLQECQHKQLYPRRLWFGIAPKAIQSLKPKIKSDT